MFSVVVGKSKKNNCCPYIQHQEGGMKEAALSVLLQGSLSLLGNTMMICLMNGYLP